MELNYYEHFIFCNCLMKPKPTKIIGHEKYKRELNYIFSNLISTKEIHDLYKFPNGILLHGKPGTGKTSLIHYITFKYSIKTFFITADIIENKFVGEGLRYIKAIFSLAKKQQPCMIFVDEIDGILSTRTSIDQSHVNSMKNLFLLMIDDIKDSNIIIIGTSNRYSSIDAAILRRLPLQLNIDVPTKEDITYLVRNTLKDEDVSKLDFDSISDMYLTKSQNDIITSLKTSARNRYMNKKHKVMWEMKDIIV